TTYGIETEAQVRAVNVRAEGATMHFEVQRQGATGELPVMDVSLNLPGNHNVLNALAAIAVATELGVPDAAIVESLAAFNGVGRRFTQVGDFPVAAQQGGGTYTVIDDYGHHPVEMA